MRRDFDRWWRTSGRVALAAVLLEHWDVVGVRETDAVPEAEYLDEADQLESAIRGREGPAAIAARLSDLAADLSAVRDTGRDRAAAEAVWRWADGVGG